jgi:ribonuclease HI
MAGARRPAASGSAGSAIGAKAEVVAWIDGGARGNPGPAGAGVVIERDAGQSEEHTLFIGVATNNVAEYAGLLAALERARLLGVRRIDVRSDSELLVKQLTGIYRVKAPHLVPLWRRARELAGAFDRFTIRHVPRKRNARADRLANLAIEHGTSSLPVPAELL